MLQLLFMGITVTLLLDRGARKRALHFLICQVSFPPWAWSEAEEKSKEFVTFMCLFHKEGNIKSWGK